MNELKLIETFLEDITIWLKNPGIPSPVVAAMYGKKKQLEEMILNKMEVKQNG